MLTQEYPMDERFWPAMKWRQLTRSKKVLYDNAQTKEKIKDFR